MSVQMRFGFRLVQPSETILALCGSHLVLGSYHALQCEGCLLPYRPEHVNGGCFVNRIFALAELPFGRSATGDPHERTDPVLKQPL